MQGSSKSNFQAQAIIQEILGHYPFVGVMVDFLVFPSLSGRKIIQVETDKGKFALREVSPKYQLNHKQVCNWLQGASSAGLNFIPKIQLARNKSGVVSVFGSNWEVSEWLPGTPWEGPVNHDLVFQAIKSLGLFHGELAYFPGLESGELPCLRRRSEILESWYVDRRHISPKINETGIGFLLEAARFLENVVPQVIKLFPRHCVKRQLLPCWGDARKNNFLFSDEVLSGFIDFEAMRLDCFESDIARLLGECGFEDGKLWERVIEIYPSQIRIDWDLCRYLCLSGVVCSLIHWHQWLSAQEKTPRGLVDLRLKRANQVLQAAQKWQKHGSFEPMLL